LLSNIEARARAICEADCLKNPGTPEEDAGYVERVWQIVAALIEAGLIDDDGNTLPHSRDTGLAAVRDWRARHPR
jgi:hypothetical protein